ncbi:MAG: hypothetical protein HYT16_02350 [DPANN group archaeon]|nr:hypothetical protein [DPANN group archaeon]
MSNNLPVLGPERVDYNGEFNFDELYRHIYDWLKWRKYDVKEKKYKDKVKALGREIEVKWSAVRDVDEYTQLQLEVEVKIEDFVDVEKTTKTGERVKMNAGNMKISVNGNLVLDKDDVWEYNLPLKFLRRFYDTYIYKGLREKFENRVWSEGWDLINEIKALLHLYAYK